MAGVRAMAAVGAIDPYSNLSFRSPPAPSITASRKLLQTSFIPNFHSRLRLRRLSSVARNKTRTRRRLLPFTVVDDLAGQYEEGFEDVHTQLINYFTYKATRTVLNQLYEMNPPKYRWFYNFLVTNKPNDSKHFLRHLGKEKQDLAERVMVTRLHLYGKWIKKCDHAKMYERISEDNLALMRERLMETVICPSDDTNTEMIG